LRNPSVLLPFTLESRRDNVTRCDARNSVAGFAAWTSNPASLTASTVRPFTRQSRPSHLQDRRACRVDLCERVKSSQTDTTTFFCFRPFKDLWKSRRDNRQSPSRRGRCTLRKMNEFCAVALRDGNEFTTTRIPRRLVLQLSPQAEDRLCQPLGQDAALRTMIDQYTKLCIDVPPRPVIQLARHARLRSCVSRRRGSSQHRPRSKNHANRKSTEQWNGRSLRPYVTMSASVRARMQTPSCTSYQPGLITTTRFTRTRPLGLPREFIAARGSSGPCPVVRGLQQLQQCPPFNRRPSRSCRRRLSLKRCPWRRQRWKRLILRSNAKCGSCGAVLIRGEKDKACPHLLVHCVSCGSYNSTDV
jgi:hypothetical protein